MDIDTLIAFHKQEASEELTYITIIFTVILGVLGYIGSVKHLGRGIRICISLIFSIFLVTFLLALAGSLEIHNALHEEIRNYAITNPTKFINGEKSMLYITLSKMKLHQNLLIIWMGVGLGLMVILGILTYGEGRLFTLRKTRKHS